MGKERRIFKNEERRSRSEVSAFLRQLAEKVDSGNVVLRQGGQETRLDLPHNLIERGAAGIVHRKGTAPADRGLVPVPGSRGTLSYVVAPVAPFPAEALASIAHGAGRKYDRSAMHGRIRTSKADRAALLRNASRLRRSRQTFVTTKISSRGTPLRRIPSPTPVSFA